MSESTAWRRRALTIAVIAVLVISVVAIIVALTTDSDEATVEFGGMKMTPSQLQEMTEESMGTDDLSKVDMVSSSDRKAELEPRIVKGVKVFNLSARPIRWEYREGQTVAAWGYEAQVPGPAIRMMEGDRVRINVTNDLPVATTVHWHGVDVPFDQDGVPSITQKAIEPGETFSYEFTARPAGTRLYHTHGSEPGDEARQLDMGLAGPLIIESPKQSKVDVDRTLVLDEWNVESDGLNVAMMSGAGHGAHNAGFNVFTINGRAMPDFEPIEVKRGQKVRLRFINAGSSAIHPMHLHGQQVTVTALDGNTVPMTARLQRNVITLQPGETTDVEFVAENPGVWMLHCHELHHADGGMMTLLKYDGYEPIEKSHGSESH